MPFALKSLFCSSRAALNHRRCRFNRQAMLSPQARVTLSELESLERKTLLAAQVIASDSPTVTVAPGDTFSVPVVYKTLDDSNNPAALKANLLSFNLHFDADALTFVESTDFFAEGIQVLPNTARPENDVSVTGDDNDADTETVLVASYSDTDSALNLGWPNAPVADGVTLYVARFTAKAGFTGTSINFSANATGTVIGQNTDFTFQAAPVNVQSTSSPPTLTIANAAAVTEGSPVRFVVSLSKASSGSVEVTYQTADGTGPNGAIAGSDFEALTNQTLTFNAGEIQKTISVATTDDNLIESAETFTVSLSNATGATISSSQAIGTINDNDDSSVSLTVADAAAVSEGEDSVFVIELSAASSANVTVDFATRDGNGPTGAVGGSDFESLTRQTLTFTPGQTLKSIVVATTDDAIEEPTEEFDLVLSSPVGAFLADNVGIGMIRDNDAANPPQLVVSDAAVVVEGESSVFTVSLSENPENAVTVNYATSDSGSTSATADVDYTATSGTLTFQPNGALTQQITVITNDDASVEQDETFAVNLLSTTGAAIQDGQGVGLISDNDIAGPNGTVQGRKFHDLNGNGNREANEPYLNGWTIQLVDSTGNVVAQQDTGNVDFNGDQQIDPESEVGWFRIQAAPGTYHLREVSRTGWKQTTPGSPLAFQAFQVDSTRELRQTVNDFFNWGGLSEKWLLGKDDWHYLTPDGSLFEWDGSPRSSLTGVFVSTLSPDYYDDLSLLANAKAVLSPAVTVISNTTSPNVNFGNQDITQPGSISGRKWNDLNGDGQRTDNEPWLNGWTIELLDSTGTVVQTTVTADVDVNQDGQIDVGPESGYYSFDNLAAGAWGVREQQQNYWVQTSPVNPDDVTAFELDQELNLFFSRSLFTNWGGLNERWMRGDAGWYYILPTGEVYEWNGSPRSALSGTKVADLTPRYHQNISLLYNARDPRISVVDLRPGQMVESINFGNREVVDTQPSDFAGTGNVEVKVSGENLSLTGDNGNNGVLVHTNDQGIVTIEGLGATTIAGQSQPFVLTGWNEIPGDLIVNLHAGNDALVFGNVRVADDVSVNTHAGNDYMVSHGLVVAGDLTYRSSSGNNTIAVEDSQVGNAAKFIGGNGNDAVYTNDLRVTGRTTAATKAGHDLFVVERSTFGNNVTVDVGTNNDYLAILGNNSFSGRLTADGRGGTDAVDADSSTVFSQSPVLRRFEQESIADVRGLLDSIMTRLADAGLDDLLSAN